MAASERGQQIKKDDSKEQWENSDFPILCETCLGDNPYVRMTKQVFGQACNICERPYTVFRWKAGKGGRYKKSVLCQTCAKMKNVCQCCIHDLEYNLPVQVRDSVLKKAEQVAIPQHDANREYFYQQAAGMGEDMGTSYAKAQANETLRRMARTQPYYKRNLPKICSFFAKGECNRGASCPFRHEMPTDRDDPLSQQKLKDRFYGHDDPVALKMLEKRKNAPKLVAPADKTITTLWVGGGALGGGLVHEADLRDAFYAHGEITSIKVIRQKNCAFVEFAERDQAQAAADALHNKLEIKGQRLRLTWANRPQRGIAGPRGGGGGGGGPGATRAIGDGTFHSVPPPPPPRRGRGAGAGAAGGVGGKGAGGALGPLAGPAPAPAAAAAAAATASAAAASGSSLPASFKAFVPTPGVVPPPPPPRRKPAAAGGGGAGAGGSSGPGGSTAVVPPPPPPRRPAQQQAAAYYPSMDPSMLGGSLRKGH